MSTTQGRQATLPAAGQRLTSLSAIVDEVIDAAQVERVSLRVIFEKVGHASFAPVLLLPAVAVATPLSGIPLFSSLMGVVICLVSIQIVFQKHHIWLPRWVLERQVRGEAVSNAFKKVHPIAGWVDARTNERFRILAYRPLVLLPQTLCLISGALMPFLEFVPFSSSVLGFGVAVLALGMLARDGLVIVLGLLPYSVVFWLITAVTT